MVESSRMTGILEPATAGRDVSKRPRTAAFFDLDKTLICENSGSVYMKSRYERGEIDGWELVRGLGSYVQYKLGVLDILSWTKAMMQEFRGRREEDLLVEAQELFARAILPAIYPEAVRSIQQHQASGHIICIVSGATRFIVEPVAQYLGVEHIVHTRLEVKDGVFTGRVIEPICFEEGKIYWLQQFIDAETVDLAKSYFYTDSVTDLPLLDLVGHPVVVNPDPLLYRAAVKRHWPVRFFEAPTPTPDADDASNGGAGTGPELDGE